MTKVGLWFAAGTCLILSACAGRPGEAKAQGKKGDIAVPVAVAPVSQRDVPLEVQVIGNVEAYSTVVIRAQVTGPLDHAHFHEGDFVRKGDLLFTIDPRPFQAAMEEAEANLERSRAQLAMSEANLKRDIAQHKYQQSQAARYTQLFKQGIMSREQTEQAESSADALAEAVRGDEAAIKSARASAAASQSAVTTAKIQLGYTTIRSPIDGRTGNMTAKEGNLVSANQTDLITINQVQPIYVTFAVPEARLGAVKQYMAQAKLPVSAQPQDDSSAPEKGVLTFIDNSVDAGTGTIKLKGTFANSDRKLWPGQFARVTLRLAQQSDALVVPSQAVQTGQDGLFVYVVKADQTVESRPVTTGSRVDQDIVVERGVRVGETIVTEGHLRLAPGMRIRVRGAEERRKRASRE
jgi:multidrug efflux system membrane fusion protein